jgi:hypothetical protein
MRSENASKTACLRGMEAERKPVKTLWRDSPKCLLSVHIILRLAQAQAQERLVGNKWLTESS